MAAAWIPAAIAIGGTVLDAYGQRKAGKAAERSARLEAGFLRRRAGEAVASSQRAAEEVGRQEELQQSRALAVAAASGGGASDPTVVNLMGNLAGEAHYRKMVALYEGSSEAQALREQADLTEQQGRQARKASKFGAVSTLLSGGASLYSKYGMKDG